MNIGVVGYGFVGTALVEGMKHAFDVFIFDELKGAHECLRSEGRCVAHHAAYVYKLNWLVDKVDGPIFVCVPTPMNKDGSCCIDVVEKVVEELNTLAMQKNRELVVAIKSTVPPGTVERFNGKYEQVHVCFNPEFLVERSAVEDFKNQDRIIVGGPREATDAMKLMYEIAYPRVPVTKTSSTIAEMVKYITNCFLATKVSFANEMKQICDKLCVDFDKVIEYVTKDKRLGTSHWAVPGPTLSDDNNHKPMLGWGGSCFVKDLNAIMFIAKELGVDPKVLSGVWEKNLEVRPEKDWENLKGRAIV